MARVPKDLPVFDGLSRRDLAKIGNAAAERRLSPSEVLLTEGTAPDEMYVLLAGALEALRCDRRGTEYVLGDIAPGELVGELAVVGKRACHATVRATKPSHVLVLPAELVRTEPKLVTNVARAISERLRVQSDLSLEYLRERSAMGELLVKSMVLLCAYAVLLSAMPWVRSTWPAASTTALSLPIIALFGLFSYRFIRATGWPLSRFGLGFQNALGSLLEAMVFTPLFAAVLVGVKWLTVHFVPSYRGLPTIEHLDVLARLADPEIRWLLVVYGTSAVVQELIVRSALQASLAEFLSGGRRSTTPILVAALMFSVTHLHMSFLFAALAFLPGLFWGWLFHRRRHLLGVSLSHYAIGVFVFFVLGVRLH